MRALLAVAPYNCANERLSELRKLIRRKMDHTILKIAMVWAETFFVATPSDGESILAFLSLLPYDKEGFNFSLFLRIYTAEIMHARKGANAHIAVSFAQSKVSCNMDNHHPSPL